jgi:hypothetical protein
VAALFRIASIGLAGSPHARLTFLGAALVTTAASSARADPEGSPVTLVWDAPSSCPKPDAVLAQIERSLATARAVRQRAAVEAHVTPGEQGRYRATLRIETGDGTSERALEAESCEAIASAVALVSVVAIEGGEMPAEPPPPAPPAPPPSIPSERAAGEASRSQLLLTAAVAADSGTMPDFTFGAEAGGGWGLRISSYRLRVLAAGSLYPSRNATVSAGHESGSFGLRTGALRICASRAFGVAELGPCLGGEIDAMNGTGVGATTTLSKTGAWGALLVSAFGALRLGSLVSLFARADGVFSPLPATFVVYAPPSSPTPYSFRYEPLNVAVRANLGLELHFF